MTKEQVISHAQYLDLIYTQSGMLYENIPNALIPSNVIPPTSSKEYHVVDGIIGSTSLHTVIKPSSVSLTASSQNPSSNPPTTSSSEINSISSNKGKSQQQPERKKRKS